MQKILSHVQNPNDEFVRIITAIDSDAGLRDAFFDIPLAKNVPILYFEGEVKRLGQKADGRKNPEIVSGIIEMAESTDVSRTKSKKSQRSKASKTREDSWLLVYICAQDGEAYATAFPRTKAQGLSDRFIPEYSPAIKPGRKPEPDIALGVQAIAELLKTAQALSKGMTMSPDVKNKVDEIWDSQPEELQQSPRLRSQFILEMYLAAFSRGSAVAEAQDLAVAVKALERQKPMRKKFFSEEIPSMVAVYIQRLRKVLEGMTRDLRKGTYLGEVAQSFAQLATTCLAYKDNDLDTFKRAWDAMLPFLVEIQVTAANGHEYQKVVPMPGETDTWLPEGYKLIHPKRNG